MTNIRNAAKYAILFVVGGLAYVCIELLARGYSHWTMFILGGICFLILGVLNEIFGRATPLFPQMVMGSVIITSLEYITGVIVNIYLGWDVWDYSHLPLNLHGQICVPYMIIWFFISFVAIALDDWVRHWLFGYPKPEYKFFK